MMIGFNCDVVVGAAVEVVGAVVVGVEVVGAAVEVVGAVVVGVEVVGVEVVVVGAAVVVVGGAVVAWSACGLGSATSLELLPHDAVSRLIARTHDPQSLRPAHLMSDSSPRPTKRCRLRSLQLAQDDAIPGGRRVWPMDREPGFRVYGYAPRDSNPEPAD